MSDNLSAILDEGERLCREATPGPWESERLGVVRAGPANEYANGSGRSQLVSVMTLFLGETETAGAMIARREADAALIAFARNNLPLLLRLVRAGAEAEVCLKRIQGTTGGCCVGSWENGLHAVVTEAIAAFGAAREGVVRQ